VLKEEENLEMEGNSIRCPEHPCCPGSKSAGSPVVLMTLLCICSAQLDRYVKFEDQNKGMVFGDLWLEINTGKLKEFT
jgi:hypothetical protein